jgi:hypothetical protein
MWKTIATDEYARKAKWYTKKKPAEYRAVVANLNAFVESLDEGDLVYPFKFGFMHDEPAGVIAIDERGAPRKVPATRLYLYAIVDRETIYLLTIGDKRSQSKDILFCRRSAEFIAANPDFGAEDGNQEQDDSDEAEDNDQG